MSTENQIMNRQFLVKGIPLLSEAHGATLEAGDCTITTLNSPPSLESTPACMAARHTDDGEAYASSGRVEAHELEGSATPYTAAESSEQPVHVKEMSRMVNDSSTQKIFIWNIRVDW
jgi:hypothetical protein